MMLFCVHLKVLKNLTVFSHKSAHPLRIGCASGFWGDTSAAIPQLIHFGKINFLIMDYLSEITMSLLAKAKMVDSTKGFTPDFLSVARYAKDLKKNGIRVVANAGGINPEGCYDELKRSFDKAGVDMNIAIVKGDDLTCRPKFIEDLETLNDDIGLLESGCLSSNVYFGASPIQAALDNGADIVITGRCVDSALVLGPLMHHFGWQNTDLDKLAAGSLAGHLIECGAQVTGGIFTDCFTVPDWWNIGFPIVEVSEDGVFSVTKPDNTGGLVSIGTVSEQLVYEIGNPAYYILPDVICDFTNVILKEISNNRIEIRGAKGIHPTNYFKVSSTYSSNYRLTAVATVIGKDAVAKGRLTGEQIIKRVRQILKHMKISDFTKINLQIIGGEDSYGATKNKELVKNVREAVVWISAEHTSKIALHILAAEVAPAGTGMAPGLTGIVGGRPKVASILKLHSSLIRKDKITATVKINLSEINVPFETQTIEPKAKKVEVKAQSVHKMENADKHYILRELAFARSGDKGDTCNIGVIARDNRAWAIIRERLTIDVVGNYFKHFFPNNDWNGNIERYELQGIKALNFVLNNSLDGGGVSSLRVDPQGKGYAQMLLDLQI